MGGGPPSFAPNPQDDDVQNNPEHDEFNADDNDRKRSRTEKDGMGAPNGSVRPVARVLFGTIGILTPPRPLYPTLLQLHSHRQARDHCR